MVPAWAGRGRHLDRRWTEDVGGGNRMSRLTELIRKTKEKDPDLGAELEREFRAAP